MNNVCGVSITLLATQVDASENQHVHSRMQSMTLVEVIFASGITYPGGDTIMTAPDRGKDRRNDSVTASL